eukprot:a339486_258.p2 GENE.a339486_258~~a339486_258.p2  ORF type:complete len:243 (-),score=75.21 a339486_258:15-719(-)
MAADNCVACNTIIDSDSVNLKNVGKYHAKCFVCVDCKGTLSSDFHLRDGQLYCSTHFNERFGVQCASCNRFISTKIIAAGEKKFHAECFICASCSAPFTSTYMMDEGLPYCNRECADQGPACADCKQPLSGSISRIGSRRYHHDCVKCTVCRTPLGDDFKTHEGKLYCVSDYRLKTGRFCYTCSKYLGDEVTKAMGREFHPECFVCTKCSAPLASFVVLKDKPYCNADCAGVAQ